MMNEQKGADIGIIGLGVMGKSFARNLAGKGKKVSVYNAPLRGEEHIVKEFVQAFPHLEFIECNSLDKLVNSLAKPAVVHLMVKAGNAVDDIIDQLIKMLSPDDIIVDGGNSNFKDTNRRQELLSAHNIKFIGMGISGGEEGALLGPSMMPGGDESARQTIIDLYRDCAAKTPKGQACINWIGKGGAGHFVKMVHNGLEYAEMQLIAEIYDILKNGCKNSNDEMAEVFESWNKGLLESYLLEITGKILTHSTNEGYTLDSILDVAGQKGTGKWTVITALELGVPIPSISAAVESRMISTQKDIRLQINNLYNVNSTFTSNIKVKTSTLERLLIGAKFSVYSQGFDLIKVASKTYGWDIDLPQLIQTWQGGCIIRSRLLQSMIDAFTNVNNLEHLLLDKAVSKFIKTGIGEWSEILPWLSMNAIPTPGLSASYNYLISQRRAELPINLIQAQRDYFGAHTYEKIDQPRGKFFHTNWESPDDEKA